MFTPSGRVFFRTRFPGFRRFRRRRFFFRNCFGTFGFSPCNNGFFFNSGFGFGSPFPYGGYPYDYSDYPPDYSSASQPEVVNSDNGANVDLAREVQRLSDQIEDLRDEQRQGAGPAASAPSSSGVSLSAQTPAESTTFVMRDGRHLVAQNYAIAGQTLWIFDEHRAQKIAVADIDHAATNQLNAANGVDLRLP